jgi:MarR-like DNA-binding transcriptional regulator SgrR of sgrS sRNA
MKDTGAHRLSRKDHIYLARYLAVVDMASGPAVKVKVEELGELWQCSPRAVRETLDRLTQWGLLKWLPRRGRGQRSELRVLVHPVHIYRVRAERAEAGGRWAEAGFWYGEILRDCPCLPDVPGRLAAVRRRLGLGPEVEPASGL